MRLSKEEIIRFRKTYNLSQKDLADILGVTLPAVVSWEVGRNNVSLPITKIVRLLIKKPNLINEL